VNLKNLRNYSRTTGTEGTLRTEKSCDILLYSVTKNIAYYKNTFQSLKIFFKNMWNQWKYVLQELRCQWK